jgi:hypothetical protein
MDVGESREELAAGLMAELGGLGQEAAMDLGLTSPVRRAEPRVEKAKAPKRKNNTAKEASAAKKASLTVVLDEEEEGWLRDRRRRIAERPPMFQDYIRFNLLSLDRAAELCFQYYMMREKKKDKETKHNLIEKCDNDLPKEMTMLVTLFIRRPGGY